MAKLSLVQWVELCEQTLGEKKKSRPRAEKLLMHVSAPNIALFPTERETVREGRGAEERSMWPLGVVSFNWLGFICD